MDTELFVKYFEGEETRGSGGVLFIKEDNTCSYIFSNEFSNGEFTNKLQELINEDEKKNIFFVLQKERNLHILSYLRESSIQNITNGVKL